MFILCHRTVVVFLALLGLIFPPMLCRTIDEMQMGKNVQPLIYIHIYAAALKTLP